MAKYVSGRQKNLKVGISSYSENLTSLEVIGNVGIATTNATSRLYVVGDGYFTGVVTATAFYGTFSGNAATATYATSAGIATYATNAGIATYATNAGIATNLKGGAIGNIPYQSGSDTTVFLTNGGSGTILQSNGPGATPSWVSAAPSGAITGITIRDEGDLVGVEGSVTQLDFVGSNISVASTSGIATITVSNNLVGTALSITGISTFSNGPVFIGAATSTGTASQRLQVTGGAYVSGSVGIGVTNPTALLHLSSGANTTLRLTDTAGSYSDIIYNESGSVSTLILDADPTNSSVPATAIVMKTDGSEHLRVDSSGNLLINTTSATGTASQPLQVTGGAYVSGNLGIGTTNPAFTADIAGDARVTSTNKMRFGGTAGTTNFYIQYNSTANSLDFVAG